MRSSFRHKPPAAKRGRVLYVCRNACFPPLSLGGHQERGRRAGTEHSESLAVLGVACRTRPASQLNIWSAGCIPILRRTARTRKRPSPFSPPIPRAFRRVARRSICRCHRRQSPRRWRRGSNRGSGQAAQQTRMEGHLARLLRGAKAVAPIGALGSGGRTVATRHGDQYGRFAVAAQQQQRTNDKPCRSRACRGRRFMSTAPASTESESNESDSQQRQCGGFG